jgi:hypothetical protein
MESPKTVDRQRSIQREATEREQSFRGYHKNTKLGLSAEGLFNANA